MAAQRVSTYGIEELERLIEQYPWWGSARLQLARERGLRGIDPRTRLVAMLHPLAVVGTKSVDVSRLTYLSADDIIDKFLRVGGHRIVAEDGDAEDISVVDFSDDDELVSEELAEIYANQGLYAEAIATYRKLSLLNSEKSIYFASLIEQLEDKRDKK